MVSAELPKMTVEMITPSQPRIMTLYLRFWHCTYEMVWLVAIATAVDFPPGCDGSLGAMLPFVVFQLNVLSAGICCSGSVCVCNRTNNDVLKARRVKTR